MMTDQFERLPFTAAAAAYARRVAMPSDKWSDVWKEKHAEAFTVAGTLSESGNRALQMIQDAMREAIDQGLSKQEFSKRFDEIVQATGWDYRGGREFRINTIYRTNMLTSFAAGRYEQMQQVKEDRPYWQYVHGGSAVPRPEHLAWDGLILHCDHPWWQTHYPPNGFGCTCSVRALDENAVNRAWDRAGGKGEPPQLRPDGGGIAFMRDSRGQWEMPYSYHPDDLMIHAQVPGRGAVMVPRGVDPGWDYNPGDAAAKAKAQAEADAARETAREAERQANEYARAEALRSLNGLLDSALAELRALQADAEARVAELAPPGEERTAAMARISKIIQKAMDAARTALDDARQQMAALQFGELDDIQERLAAALADVFRSTRSEVASELDRLKEVVKGSETPSNESEKQEAQTPETLDAARTPTEIQRYLQAQPELEGIDVSFVRDDKASPEAVRSASKEILGVASRFGLSSESLTSIRSFSADSASKEQGGWNAASKELWILDKYIQGEPVVVTPGVHPPGGAGIAGLVAHELGHAIDGLMRIDPEAVLAGDRRLPIAHLFRAARFLEQPTPGFSSYAESEPGDITRSSEWFAEAFSEYMALREGRLAPGQSAAGDQEKALFEILDVLVDARVGKFERAYERIEAAFSGRLKECLKSAAGLELREIQHHIDKCSKALFWRLAGSKLSDEQFIFEASKYQDKESRSAVRWMRLPNFGVVEGALRLAGLPQDTSRKSESGLKDILAALKKREDVLRNEIRSK